LNSGLATARKSESRESQAQQGQRGWLGNGSTTTTTTTTTTVNGCIRKEVDLCRTTLRCSYSYNIKAAAQATAASQFTRTNAGEAVLYQRHGTRIRQGSTANICCGGIHGDAGKRENVPHECRVYIDGRGTGDIPIQAGTCTRIDHVHDRIGRGDQRGFHLEDPGRVGVALAVESERPRQVGRSGLNRIDAWKERESNQVRKSQYGTSSQGCKIISRGGEISLSLHRIRRPCLGPRVYKPSCHLRVRSRNAWIGEEAGDCIRTTA